jgi:hypothetical protein
VFSTLSDVRAERQEAGATRGEPPDLLPPDPADPFCPACGRSLRWHGRRRSVTIYECEASDCPTSIVELLDPGEATK